jgi:hypothetical protein
LPLTLCFDVDNTMVVVTDDAPSCAPTQILFDAINELSKRFLSETCMDWFYSILVPSSTPTIDRILPLDMLAIEEIDICDYLGQSMYPMVHCLP